MIWHDRVRQRIADRVPALPLARIGSAAQWGLLVEQGTMPQQSPMAYVLPGGMRAGKVEDASGAFIQGFVETVFVVLVVRVAGDATGEKAMAQIGPMVRDVMAAIAGWVPDDGMADFILRQAELVGTKGDQLVFQIDFEIFDQLRINPT